MDSEGSWLFQKTKANTAITTPPEIRVEIIERKDLGCGFRGGEKGWFLSDYKKPQLFVSFKERMGVKKHWNDSRINTGQISMLILWVTKKAQGLTGACLWLKKMRKVFLMICPRHFLGLFLALTAGLALAQDPAPAQNSTSEDLRAMRQLIEQQTLKIDSLTQQVGKLNQQLETAHPAVTGSAPVHPTEAPVAKPTQEVKPQAEPPKAEPVTPLGQTHVVARGETLTSIAKHYKTSVFDLLKANKIEDDRKLQIGQTLVIPTTKDPAPPNTPKGD